MLYSLMENVFLKFGFEVPGKVLDSLFSLSQGLPEKQNQKEIICRGGRICLWLQAWKAGS